MSRMPRAGFGRLERATHLGPGAVSGWLAERTFDVLNKFNMPFAFLQVARIPSSAAVRNGPESAILARSTRISVPRDAKVAFPIQLSV